MIYERFESFESPRELPIISCALEKLITNDTKKQHIFNNIGPLQIYKYCLNNNTTISNFVGIHDATLSSR